MHSGGPPQSEAPAASSRRWLAAAGAAGLLAALPGLLALARVWSTVDYYAHGFLVPAVSWWALHRDRARWSGLSPHGDRRGVPLLVLALLGYAGGLAAGLPWLIGLSLVGALAAAVLVAAGGAVLRAVAFPVGFLVFMAPLPDPLLGPLIRDLQLVVSDLASRMLGLSGIPVERAGNVLVLPTGEQLFVAEACSGVTSLISEKSCQSRMMPPARAMATRWMSRLVEPPVALSPTMPLTKARSSRMSQTGV